MLSVHIMGKFFSDFPRSSKGQDAGSEKRVHSRA